MGDNASQAQYEYDAFISYRHVTRDMQVAEKLHYALENYRTPKYLVKRGVPARLKKVFRDREELPTSSDLGQDIENALKRSRFLIVICSLEAVQSKWVLKEVELFAGYHGYDRILTLLIDGEPETAFPPCLIRQLFDEQGEVTKVIEPLAADVRQREKATLTQLLKVEKLRIIAGILGCKYDELRQREHERRVRKIVTLSVSTGVFLLALTAFTFWQLNQVNAARAVAVLNEKQAVDAKNQAQDAEAKTKQSEQDALEQQSNLYATLAKRAAESGDKLLGMSLAMEALPKDLANPERPVTQDAKDALYYSAAQHGMQVLTYLYPPTATAEEIATACFFTSDGSIATAGGRAVRQFNVGTGRLSREWLAQSGYQVLAVSPQADRAVIAHYESGVGLDVQLWDMQQDRMVSQYAFASGDDVNQTDDCFDLNGTEGILKAGFGPDGKSFFVFCNEYYYKGGKSDVCVYDAASGTQFFRQAFDDLTTDVILKTNLLAAVVYNGVINDGDEQENIYVYDIQKNQLRSTVITDGSSYIDGHFRTVGISCDEKKLEYETGKILHITDLDTGESQEIATESCEISSDGNMVAYFRKDAQQWEQFVVLDIVRNKELVVLENKPELQMPKSLRTILDPEFCFCSNNRYIIFEDSEMLDINRAELYLLPINNCVWVESDAGGKYLAAIDIYGKGSIIQLQDPKVYETEIPGEYRVAIRDDGVLLQDQSGRGTVLKWDAVQKTVSATASDGSDIADWLEDNLISPNSQCGFRGYLLYKDDSVVVTDDMAVYRNTLYIYDSRTGNQKATIKMPDTHGNKNAVGYRGILVNGGEYLMTITASTNQSGSPQPVATYGNIHLMLWDCGTGKAVAALYDDYSTGTDILDFGLVNGGKEIVIISQNNGKTYIRTIPFYDAFDQIYSVAKEKLGDREFDLGQDLDHIQ